ncbi:hypothetical protein ACFOG5_11635 [Pedobacter fastidiosus]|uniref:Uncharacterized protein n=1 Tax=Pedobacter fastidiosus TaxID=2765361 RepID=A0ABR7KYE9_9SPHI|nr:hypothetical protein [Pedobacter fastidiosus]MBC6112929.1 hypothetical protein [Pedobacter fastidiosus]
MYRNFTRIMKLTTFILIVSMMQVSAAGFAQRLNLKQNNISLEKVFLEVRKQTGYDVFFENTKIKTSSRINADFQQRYARNSNEQNYRNEWIVFYH